MYIIISERGAILRASNIITRLLRMSYYIVRDYARGWQDTPRVAVRDSTRPSKDKQIANELWTNAAGIPPKKDENSGSIRLVRSRSLLHFDPAWVERATVNWRASARRFMSRRY